LGWSSLRSAGFQTCECAVTARVIEVSTTKHGRPDQELPLRKIARGRLMKNASIEHTPAITMANRHAAAATD
jgi:hypothetical protein